MAREERPPVIVVMGHIDHGKSSLLDYIRKSNVVAGEHGGITQHVAAYVAEHGGRKVTFLDTPGHEAFKTLRTRGAAAADIAILVVAADEGVMPQTLDALAAIREAGIPFIIGLTKIDKRGADLERTKASLLEHGIYLEGMGGDVAFAPVSSKTGEGVSELLDLVLLAADLSGVTADSSLGASGFVLESTQDPRRGTSATLIVKDGTLHRDEFVVAGDAYAPVRFIEDFRGARVESAGPSQPARISGFSTLPEPGTLFRTVASKKEAEAAAAENVSEAPTSATADDDRTVLPIIIKADAAGSLDAIMHECAKAEHPRAALRVVASGIGNVSEGDVKTASASGAHILAFNVGADAIARDLALRDGVTIEAFTVIYALSKRLEELLVARAPVALIEKELGRAKVLKLFSSTAKKKVLGLRLISGVFSVGNDVKILRREADVGRGTVANLQQARADVSAIRTEGEFGAEIETKTDAAPGDELVAFSLESS